MNNKVILSQRVDPALFSEIKNYADANTAGNIRGATERLLHLGLESLTKKAATPLCPSTQRLRPSLLRQRH